MSKTLYVSFREDGFWAYDVVTGAYLKHMIEAAADSAHATEPWLVDAVGYWRFNAICGDCGLYLDDAWTPEQVDAVVAICDAARAAIERYGDFAAADIEAEPIFEDRCIFVRGHDPVPAAPLVRFGDGLIALLQARLAAPPAGYAWFYALEAEPTRFKCPALGKR